MSLTSTISSYFWVNVLRSTSPGSRRQAGEHFGVHAGDAGRRFLQALAVGVFADGQEDFADGRLDALVVHWPVGGAVFGVQGRPARSGGGVGHAQRRSRKGEGGWCRRCVSPL